MMVRRPAVRARAVGVSATSSATEKTSDSSDKPSSEVNSSLGIEIDKELTREFGFAWEVLEVDIDEVQGVVWTELEGRFKADGGRVNPPSTANGTAESVLTSPSF